MIHIKEAIVVEGRYDKIKLSQVTDAFILETNGFRIFKDAEMRNYIKRLAAECGIVILTDSDRAGFLIRNHLKSFLPREQIKQAYIPEQKGKEKRKIKPSKEGLLGVEGMEETVLLEALRRAGCVAGDASGNKMELSQSDLYADGLLGGSGSAEYRRRFCAAIGLPQRLSGKDFLAGVNRLLTPKEYREILFEIKEEKSR